MRWMAALIGIAALAEHLKTTAREPERFPADGDVARMLDYGLPSRDWAEPARK